MEPTRQASGGSDSRNDGQKKKTRTRKVLHSIERWFGLDEDEVDSMDEKWKARARNAHHHAIIGKKPKKDERDFDEVDGSGRSSRRRGIPRRSRAAPSLLRESTGTDGMEMGAMIGTDDVDARPQIASRVARLGIDHDFKQPGLVDMAMDGAKSFFLGTVRSERKPTIHSRSFAPAALRQYGELVTSPLDDDFFSTKDPVDDVDNSRKSPYTIGPDGDWDFRDGPSIDTLDTGLDDLAGKVSKAFADNADRVDYNRRRLFREFDHGVFQRCMDVQWDLYYDYRISGTDGTYIVADRSQDHRVGFTLWLTFIQIIILIVSVSVYGFAPIGFGTKEYSQEIIQPSLSYEKVSYKEPQNFWIGPRQADLIHLGAKYSPCMRWDDNVMGAIGLDRKLEAETACCINNDGSGCRQSSRAECSKTLANWLKWSEDSPALRDINRTSGAVCGQDPKYCKVPESLGQYQWEDDITKWPVCLEQGSYLSGDDNAHLGCQITGRPCCLGIQGQCEITTREDCDFKKGYFHEEATLCSQVNCMEDICGMLPFANPEAPDQFYRFGCCMFLHAGIIHLLVTLFFNAMILWPIERLAGWLRVCLIYFISGIGGGLASAIFLPYHVEAGPAGAQFGMLACHLVTIILYMDYPRDAILKLLLVVVILLLFGLFPWIDNYAHIVGFVCGLLTSFIVLPFAKLPKTGSSSNRRVQRLITIVVCFILLCGVLATVIILFYVAPIYECPYCEYLNCIPVTEHFCDSMKVTMRYVATY